MKDNQELSIIYLSDTQKIYHIQKHFYYFKRYDELIGGKVMMNHDAIIEIRDKLTNNKLFCFVGIMGIIGFIFNIFEPYPLFFILCPLLLVMLISTTVILRESLKKLSTFVCDKGVLEKFF